MRIGLLFDLQHPRPWAAEDEGRLLAQTLELVVLADGLGFASAWVQEHHFLEEAGHGGGAVPLLGALAARTTHIRLGLSVLSVDPQVRHPAVLAADVATVDGLSGGRVEVATGVALAGVEVAGLGLARQTARVVWEHGTGVLARMLAELPFTGAPATAATPALPPRTVVPRPVQRPHPPLWARADKPAQISGAARLGLGALCRAGMEPEEAGEWVAEYRTVIGSASCVPIGLAVQPRVAVCLPMSVHEDEATAIAQGLDAAHFAAYATAHFERFGEHVPGGTDLRAAFTQRREDVGLCADAVVADGAPLSVRVLRDGRAALRGAIGTPDQVAELVGRYAAAGVDELLLLVPAGRPGDHEATCASLRLFAGTVLAGVEAEAPDPALEAAVRAALARRPAPPVLAPGEAVGASAEARPVVSAQAPVPPMPGAGGTGPVAAPEDVRRRLRERLATGGTVALRRAVQRADDRWIERTLGSSRGLRTIFTAMGARFVPEAAGGFLGAITYELTDTGGLTRSWSVRITSAGASVVSGSVADPDLTVVLGVADFVRVAAGEEDPARLLLSGKMDLRGDFSLATRLGPMFGA